MNIGQAASASGLPAKTIRYYESIGLIADVGRSASGYRDYRSEDVQALRFLRRARSLGFSVEQCRELLSLQLDPHRASADVRTLATRHLEEIGEKIRELEEMKAALEGLVSRCRGDHRPHCPILENLAAEEKRK